MRVILSGNLRRYTDFEGEVELEAASISEALEALVAKFPALRASIYDADSNLRSVHRLYLNGRSWRVKL